MKPAYYCPGLQPALYLRKQTCGFFAHTGRTRRQAGGAASQQLRQPRGAAEAPTEPPPSRCGHRRKEESEGCLAGNSGYTQLRASRALRCLFFLKMTSGAARPPLGSLPHGPDPAPAAPRGRQGAPPPNPRASARPATSHCLPHRSRSHIGGR